VDAFIAGHKVPKALRGTNYMGLFHVSDWFPTMLSMAGLTLSTGTVETKKMETGTEVTTGQAQFSPKPGYELDGSDHFDALFNGATKPREYMLYNYYYNVQHATNLGLWSYGGGAIRTVQYKLLHGHGAAPAGQWFPATETLMEDDDLTQAGGCTQDAAWEGDIEVGYGIANWLTSINKPNQTANSTAESRMYNCNFEANRLRFLLLLAHSCDAPCQYLLCTLELFDWF
jgi:hypothetical protein